MLIELEMQPRRSHSGYVLMLSGGAISWKSRRQDNVSLSTSETEYVAASQCGQDVLYLREMLSERQKRFCSSLICCYRNI